MEDIWNLLDIEPSADIHVIKRAAARSLSGGNGIQ